MIPHNRMADILTQSSAQRVQASGRESDGRLLAFRDWLGETLADYPKMSLFAAMSAGALVGWIVKRR
jgi:hypothetical protein